VRLAALKATTASDLPIVCHTLRPIPLDEASTEKSVLSVFIVSPLFTLV